MSTRVPEVPDTDEGTATAFAFIMSRHRMLPEKSDELNTVCSCGHVETLDGEGWFMHIGRDLTEWMKEHASDKVDWYVAYTNDDGQMWITSRSADETKRMSRNKDVRFERHRKLLFQHYQIEELPDF